MEKKLFNKTKREATFVGTIHFRIEIKGKKQASQRKENLMLNKAQLEKFYVNLLQQEVDLLEAEVKRPDLPRAFRSEAKRDLRVAKARLTRAKNRYNKVANSKV